MIKLVIIDFDDTLSMTEELGFHFENDIARLMGYEPMTREAHRKNWGKPLKEGITERIPGIDGDIFVSLFERELPRMIRQSDKHDFIPDRNFEALRQMKKDGKKVVILTSRSENEAIHLMHEDHPLSQIVDGFYHRGNSEYMKPNPMVFDPVLKRFEAAPNEAVYIGDSPSDAECAKGAGLYFIGVLESGVRTKKDFSDFAVDYFVDKFSEVTSYIENRN